MTGLPLILVFILAIVVMIIMISKFKIHPFVSIMCISLVLGLIAGIPIVDRTLEDGTKVSGLASVIGAGFSGTFSSIGIVIILGALIGSILEVTGAALSSSSSGRTTRCWPWSSWAGWSPFRSSVTPASSF